MQDNSHNFFIALERKMKKALSIILVVLICIGVSTLSVIAIDEQTQGLPCDWQSCSISVGSLEIPQEFTDILDVIQSSSVVEIIIGVIIAIVALIVIVVVALVLIAIAAVVVGIIIEILIVLAEILIPILITISAGLAPFLVIIGGIIALVTPVVESLSPDLAQMIIEYIKSLVSSGAIILPII